jgi:4-amino-4-deoxy-L-arabinose transferase-like glycosyltransferase
MRVRWFITNMQLIAVLLSVANVVRFRLQNLMIERSAELDRLALLALAIAAAATVAGLFTCWRRGSLSRVRGLAAVLLMALTVAAGFMPDMVESRLLAADRSAGEAERLQRDQAFARELRDWTSEIDRRIANHAPLPPEQAWAFLDCVSTAGYRDEGDAPPSSRAIAVLQKALGAGLIDVNAGVPSHRAKDPEARPLALQFYRERIEPLRRVLARQDWEIMRLLAQNGADLSSPEAAPLVEDLGRRVVPGPSRYISLN